MKYRRYSLLLALLIVFTLCPLSVFAKEPEFVIEEYEPGGYWHAEDCPVLKKYNGDADVVKVPDGIKTIDEGAFVRKSMTKLILPEGLKGIGYEAFVGCYDLKEVNFPDSLEYIDDAAFSGTAIEQAILPDGIKRVGNDAFCYCEKLTEVSIPTTAIVGSDVFELTSWQNAQFEKNDFAVSDGVVVGVKNCTSTITYPDGVIKVCSLLDSDRLDYESPIKILVVPPTVSDMNHFIFQYGHSIDVHTVYGIAGCPVENDIAQGKYTNPFLSYPIPYDLTFIPLALTKDKVTLDVDKTAQLALNSGSEAKWKSSNSKVAKVSKTGKVTALGSGKATITAEIYGTKFSCNVTVKGQPIKTYTVKRGDSLWSIAAKQLGNGSSYREIMKVNGLKKQIIYAGQKLILPQK